MTERFQRPAHRGLLDVAVIRLPRISNFTDLNPLSCVEQVSLRYVHSAGELGEPHLIILPGTKNTMEDLRWLRQCGLEAAICRHAAQGRAVMGICGGYQMLGRSLRDPDGVEAGGQMRGMGLWMPKQSSWRKNQNPGPGQGPKCRRNLFPVERRGFTGYEIHMGRTTSSLPPFSGLSTGQADGLWSGNVFGTYVHGIF